MTANFKQIELDYEARNLSPNRALLDLARRFARRGGKVMLISDMYLDAKSISGLVREVCGAVPYISRVVSSADTVVSKASGLLFPEIEHEIGVPGSRILHVGDSIIGDYRKPRQAGWNAEIFPIAPAEMARRKMGLRQMEALLGRHHAVLAGWLKL